MNNWRAFNFTNPDFMILTTIETYNTTASGKSWQKKPIETEYRIFKPEQYTNYITAIPFFNNFDHGAYCKGYYNYTAAGYLPDKVVTVSPFKSVKKVARFDFIFIPHLLKAAGWRESEIVKNAKTFKIKYYDGSTLLYLYTLTDGVLSSGCFDLNKKIWRG